MKNKTFITHKLGISFYAMLVAVIFCGCGEPIDQSKIDPNKNVSGEVMNNPNYQIVTVDSCEYILYRKYEGGYSSFSSGLCHKGNCKFCAERSKK